MLDQSSNDLVNNTVSGYFATFVCWATKATCFATMTSVTTDTFLAAFRNPDKFTQVLVQTSKVLPANFSYSTQIPHFDGWQEEEVESMKYHLRCTVGN